MTSAVPQQACGCMFSSFGVASAQLSPVLRVKPDAIWSKGGAANRKGALRLSDINLYFHTRSFHLVMSPQAASVFKPVC